MLGERPYKNFSIMSVPSYLKERGARTFRWLFKYRDQRVGFKKGGQKINKNVNSTTKSTFKHLFFKIFFSFIKGWKLIIK